MTTLEDAEFYKWVGTIERTPSYFTTKGDLILHGVPEELWRKLSEKCESVRMALGIKGTSIENLDSLRNDIKNLILSRQEDAASEQIVNHILDKCDKKYEGNEGEYAFRCEMLKELGDVLYYIARNCDYCGFSLEDVAIYNIEKLTDRKQRGTLQGDGSER